MHESLISPSESAPSAHERIDQISKTTLALAGVFFAVGMVIDNIQLQALGIYDVSIVQPRFVLVGVAFAVYLLLPAILLAIPIAVFRWSPRACSELLG